MNIGKTEKYLLERLEDKKVLIFVLIDPDKQPLEKGLEIAKLAGDKGADVITIGGSIGVQGDILDNTVKMIKEEVDLPVILFPGNVGGLTKYADALFFMRMLNSRDIYWVSTAQILAAPLVKRIGIEAIPTGYIILEPGRAVGWVGNANLIPRDRGDLAAATALSAEYSGNRWIIFDSGSGAEKPPSPQFMKIITSIVSIPIIYGGGIKTTEDVENLIRSGVKGLHIGTAFELKKDIETKMEKIIKKRDDVIRGI